jgi:uncharacterized membrane protein YidH (DUF202 family)
LSNRELGFNGNKMIPQVKNETKNLTLLLMKVLCLIQLGQLHLALLEVQRKASKIVNKLNTATYHSAIPLVLVILVTQVHLMVIIYKTSNLKQTITM